MARQVGTSSRVDPVELIAATNQGRRPDLLARKFAAMAGDAFVFLRASAGLGHRSVDLAALPPTPVAWICGDLHLQNFGSFRGNNRLVYFDLNDFDEAARLPVSLDLLRLLGSLLTAAPGIGLGRAQALAHARNALEAYARALARGKAYWLERDTAVGPIRQLLRQTAARKRRDLLATRTVRIGARRRIAIDGSRYLAVPDQDPIRGRIEHALGALAAHYGDKSFFELRDIAFRVAGMGSLGVRRYVALVAGKGDPDRNALIDFKHAVPSAAIGAFPRFAQFEWGSEAERVAGIQDLSQAASPAFLSAMPLDGLPFVVRELQPVEDKIALPPLGKDGERLEATLGAMARLSAYAQLRGASRHGAAGADELIEFGLRILAAPAPWIDAARAVCDANDRAFTAFAKAWKERDPRLTDLLPPPGSPARAPKTGTRKANQDKASRKKAGAGKASAKKANARKANARKADASKAGANTAGANTAGANTAGAKKVVAKKVVAKKASASKTGSRKTAGPRRARAR